MAHGNPKTTRARYTSPTILSFRQKRYGHGASMLMAWIGVGAVGYNSAYVEVQAGAFRNQETYAFLQPAPGDPVF